ncbi:hypothetical protein VNO78_24254 [Psophocarpus tetragonolobus]|uniref:Uncharacterized protein n=1 Tax=Psophocarpus tetragonolobus TaxID=3891 RepID=A0AAN9S4Z7_PSOTE
MLWINFCELATWMEAISQISLVDPVMKTTKMEKDLKYSKELPLPIIKANITLFHDNYTLKTTNVDLATSNKNYDVKLKTEEVYLSTAIEKVKRLEVTLATIEKAKEEDEFK